MNEQTRKGRIAEFERRCQAAGLPLTAQRRAVMDVVAGRTDHPAVDQIHGAVSERLPGISRATVYRVLETLLGLGVVRRVDHPGSTARFDGNTEPHDHFLCMLCGAIRDLAAGSLEGLEALALAGEPAFDVREIRVNVRGRCASCRRAGGPGASM